MRLVTSPVCLRTMMPSDPAVPGFDAAGLLRKGRLLLTAILVFACWTALAQAQQYTSIVVFGDSLSDTGNDAVLTLHKYLIPVPAAIPGLEDYTYGRFTDGPDTWPATTKYKGVWVEQLAGMLPAHPAVSASLLGGRDYAYGFAETGSGTGVFTLNSSGTEYVTIHNVGQQITDYLATHPKIDSHTLFIVWSGAIDVLYASGPEDVVKAAIDQAGNVQRLIQAGATHILVPNLPPLGATPRFNTMPSEAATATEGAILFNDTLSASLDVVEALEFWHFPHVYRLNVYSLFNSVIASPQNYGLTDVKDMSQGVLTVNPDEYLFWDNLHPTTHGHDILALAALKLVDPAQCAMESAPWMQPTCEAVP